MTDRLTSVPSNHFARQVAIALLLPALLLNAWLLTRNWNESLLDLHEFRQVQTALSAYYIKKDGAALAYETPVLGPPWSIPMEFPTYQTCVAGLSRMTGMHLEQTGRLINVLFFYACLPAVWLLLGRWQLATTTRACVLLGFLTCPLFAFYSRTFMIESTALCLGLWFLWAFWAALDRFSGWRLALAVSLGVLAALTKVTTFVVVGVPAGILALALCFDWQQGRPHWRGWLTPVVAAAGLLLPLAAAFAWVRFSDHQKLLNPYASFLTSASLHEWNWGTWAQRFKPEFWREIHTTTTHDVLGEPAFLVTLGLLPAVARTARRRALLCLALYFSGCLLFSNLYYVHDYYSYATAGFLVTALGIVLGSLLEESRLPLPAGIVLLVLTLGTQFLAFSRGYGDVYRRANPAPSPFAEIVRRTTDREDVLVAFGLDWNGLIPYYSERRAVMVPAVGLSDRAALKKSIDGLGIRRVGAMIVAGDLRVLADFVGPKVREFGLEGFPIASTDTMDLYLRADLHERARQDLAGNTYPGVSFALERKKVNPNLPPERNLTVAPWAGQFTMASPAPYAFRGQYQPAVIDRYGKPAIHVQSAAELLFLPPAGARQLEVVGGLVAESYSNGNATDGVILQVLEEFNDGRRRLLAERELRPLSQVADRVEVTLKHVNDQPYQGRIVVRLDPGPLGNINCDWGYWSSIKIY